MRAFQRALSLDVERGELSRRWQTGGLPPGEVELEVSNDVLKQLGIGFGRPNFLLKGQETYSVWLEFPFTKFTRPDLFIIEGMHSSAFQPSVRMFLNDYNDRFYQDVLNEWRSGFVEGLIIDGQEAHFSEGTSPGDVRDFLSGLAEHLKAGAVIESKEDSNEAGEAERQIQLYHSIFRNQSVSLLTWFEWNGRVPSNVEVIDQFGTDEQSKREFAETIRQLT